MTSESEAPPPPRRAFDRRRLAPLVLVAALVAIWLVLGPRVPKDQTVHVVLGDAAPRVTEIRIAYSTPGGANEPAREATFAFVPQTAPRIVTHEPRLPDGDYTVEIDVARGNDRATVSRRVRLEGSPVSIDVREAVP